MSYDKCSIAFYACAENITPAKDLPDNEEEVEFNDQFLLNGSANIDINRFHMATRFYRGPIALRST